jgi:hypothetical protein
MKINTIICTGLLMLGLLSIIGIAAAQQDTSGTDTSGTVIADDIQPYNGTIGADSPLYGLKLALENVDESFTANETERVDKEMDHAQLRLAEVQRALDLNESGSAREALDNYWLKMNLTNTTISQWNSNTTGLLHAQEMIAKHQFVLEHLLETHPGNPGLEQAYNNSIWLEDRFANKTDMWINRTIDKDNRTILHLINREDKDRDHHTWPGMNITLNETHPWPNWTPPSEKHDWPNINETENRTFPQPSWTPASGHVYGWEKNGNNQTPAIPTSGNGWLQGQGHQQNGNGDNQGKGNPHNK